MDTYHLARFLYYDMKTKDGIFIFINGCSHSYNYKIFMDKYLKFKQLYNIDKKKCFNNNNNIYMKYNNKFMSKCVEIPDKVFKKANLLVSKSIIDLTKKKVNKKKVKTLWNTLFGNK